jgi:hypothetical protein
MSLCFVASWFVTGHSAKRPQADSEHNRLCNEDVTGGMLFLPPSQLRLVTTPPDTG